MPKSPHRPLPPHRRRSVSPTPHRSWLITITIITITTTGIIIIGVTTTG
jgi:hypothetical protein